MITLALSKGRIFDETLPLLAAAGIEVLEDPEKSRKLILPTNQPNVRVVLVRATDVPTYVEYGGADIGVTGKDTLIEHGGQGLYQPLDLRIAKCRISVAVRADFARSRPELLADYVNLLHAAAEDFALRFRHRRRQGQNDVSQLARRGRTQHFGALGRAVDLHQRLRQQLREHQRHHGTAAVVRGKHRQTFLRCQIGQRLAFVVDQKRQRHGGSHRLLHRAVAALAETPAWRVTVFIPQIAARAGKSGGAFRSFTQLCQTAGFAAGAQNRRPDKSVITATFD